jgi:hypothetical protein
MRERNRLQRDAPDESHKSRYLAIVAVVALHLAIITGIIAASRFPYVMTSNPYPLEITFFPPEAKVVIQPPSAQPARNPLLEETPPPSPATPSLEMVPTAPSNAHSGSGLDWEQEAQTVAAAKAQENSVKSRRGLSSPPASNSPFTPPPTHHAGEEFTTPSGERAVFVGDDCYQIARPFNVSPNASNNGMVTPTYCIGKSHAARGDLFDQLPAYKKRHGNDSSDEQSQ